MKLHIAMTICLLGFSTSSGYNVLFHHSFGTKSHLIQFSPIVEELLNRGHKVTAVFFDTLKIKHENYTEILIPNGMEKPAAITNKLFMEDGGQNSINTKLWKKANEAWTEAAEDIALQQFSVEKFRALLESDTKFHVLVTMFYRTGAFLADVFDCPILLISPAGPISFVMEGTGNEINLSIQPSSMSRSIEPLSFFERLENHIRRKGESWFMNWLATSIHHHLQETIGEHTRHPLDILQDRLSVILSASHPVTHGSWPYLPNYIEIGGLHMRDPNPLPEDLKVFMDSAKKGVVLVSFGSSLKPSDLPKEKLDIFLNTFKRLDMSVIWKWDSDIANLPPNVLTKSWLPQQDLLGHPNLKVFVTHGGLGSVMEAIYHKTVLVGIPIVNDQKPNLLRAARHGYAKILELDSLTADELTESINDGAKSETMRSALELVHNLYLDRQQRPVDTAIWWMEYVCRHGGAPVLQSHLAEDAPWYQYHHVDVLLFLIAILCALCSAIVFFCCVCCKCCCKRKLKVE